MTFLTGSKAIQAGSGDPSTIRTVSRMVALESLWLKVLSGIGQMKAVDSPIDTASGLASVKPPETVVTADGAAVPATPPGCPDTLAAAGTGGTKVGSTTIGADDTDGVPVLPVPPVSLLPPGSAGGCAGAADGVIAGGGCGVTWGMTSGGALMVRLFPVKAML